MNLEALEWACKNGSLAQINDTLTEFGSEAVLNARLGRYSVPCLSIAARHERESLVTVLLSLGADPNAGDKNNKISLHYASETCCSSIIVKLLIKAGANINAKINWNGNSVLHTAAQYHGAESIQVLLDAGANPNARDRIWETPLHAAAKKRKRGNAENPAVMRVLLLGGAKVTLWNRQLERPLHIAARCQNADTVEAILFWGGYMAPGGPDINVQVGSDKNTALHIVTLLPNPDPEIIKLLFRAGANVNAYDRYGLTPFHHAALKTKPNIIRLFITHVKNFNIDTPQNAKWKYTAYDLTLRTQTGKEPLKSITELVKLGAKTGKYADFELQQRVSVLTAILRGKYLRSLRRGKNDDM